MFEPSQETGTAQSPLNDAGSVRLNRLLALILLKDAAAFTELYAITSSKLFGVILGILRERSNSEDILQDVYLKIWARPDLYKADVAAPMSWLIRIAVNCAIDKRRRFKNVTVDPDQAEVLDVADPAPCSLSLLQQKEQSSKIALLVDGLGLSASEAMRLAFYEDHSYREVANRLGIPEGTAKSIIRRSIEKLRREMEFV